MPGMRAMSRVQQHEEWRQKIQASQLINRLNSHAKGECEMTATQIKAATVLLAKVMPDLKAVEHSGTVTTQYESLSDDQLNAQIASRLQAISQTVASDA